eukprot:447827_1
MNTRQSMQKLDARNAKKINVDRLSKVVRSVAKMVKNPFTDDDSKCAHWYHPQCIFDSLARAKKTTKKIESESDLVGFTDLLDADQTMLRGLISTDHLRRASHLLLRLENHPDHPENKLTRRMGARSSHFSLRPRKNVRFPQIHLLSAAEKSRKSYIALRRFRSV